MNALNIICMKLCICVNILDFFSTIKLNENFKNKNLKVSGIHTLGANTSFIWKSIKSPAESSAIILMLKIAKSKKSTRRHEQLRTYNN